jgi:GMP synthase-like glutamine amidotransferase
MQNQDKQYSAELCCFVLRNGKPHLLTYRRKDQVTSKCFRVPVNDNTASYAFALTQKLLKITQGKLAPWKGITSKSPAGFETNIWITDVSREWLKEIALCNNLVYHKNAEQTKIVFLQISDLDADHLNAVVDSKYYFSLVEVTRDGNFLDGMDETTKIHIQDHFHRNIFESKDFEITPEDEIYALFNCEPTSNWAGAYEALYIALLRSPGEKWRVFHVAHGQDPSDAELKQLKAIVLSGSYASSYIEYPWSLRLQELIRKIYTTTEIRILGVCYGHQLVAHTLGGRASRRDGPMVKETETLQFTEECLQNPFLGRAIKEAGLDLEKNRIAESHEDEVAVLPEEAILCAKSKTAGVEMYYIPNRVMGLQGHPEFNRSVIALIRSAKAKSKYEELYDSLEGKYEASQNKEFHHICKAFLHH